MSRGRVPLVVAVILCRGAVLWVSLVLNSHVLPIECAQAARVTSLILKLLRNDLKFVCGGQSQVVRIEQVEKNLAHFFKNFPQAADTPAEMDDQGHELSTVGEVVQVY